MFYDVSTSVYWRLVGLAQWFYRMLDFFGKGEGLFSIIAL